MINYKILVTLFIVILTSKCKVENHKDLVSVKVEITGKGKAVSRDKYETDSYFAKLTVTNIQDTSITFGMYTCAWYSNWIFNNDSFKFSLLGCDKNVFESFVLKPSKSITFYCAINPNSTKIKEFKMGFIPLSPNAEINVHGDWMKFIKSQKAYWSNDIKLDFENNSFKIDE